MSDNPPAGSVPAQVDVTRFPAPLAHLSRDAQGFDHHWMQIQFVFDLPSPYDFPTIEGIPDDERPTLQRYVRNCCELAESTLLSHGGGLTTTVRNGVEMTTELDIPPKEIIRGAAVLFRLVGNDTDAGGFGRARKILERRAHEAADGVSVQQLKLWRGVRAQLSTRMLRLLVYERMHELRLGGLPRNPSTPGPSPTQLIALFGNGDLIHQGTHLEAFERSAQDPHSHNRDWFDYISSVLQLSHFYLGYAALVDSALGEDRTLPPGIARDGAPS